MQSTSTHDNAEMILDLRPLVAQGGTPCSAIDEAVARLAPNQSLVLILPFEPVPLYDKLGALGFSHSTQSLPDGTWRVAFLKDKEADPAATPATVKCCCSGND